MVDFTVIVGFNWDEALLERALDIGANDMLDDGPAPIAAPVAPSPPAPPPSVIELAASA